MKYDLVKPCRECPFRRGDDGPVRLMVGRVEELCEGAGRAGHEFACHKTVEYDDEDDGKIVRTSEQQHCAGALIFGLKHDGPHQMGRIVERLRMWDPSKHEPHFDEVFDDVDEMKATAIDASRKKRRRP